jgi:serine phosphatase RsbU (regulator of sigma subunit)
MQNLTRRSILYGSTALVFAFVYLVVVKQITRFSASVFGRNVEVIEAGFIVLSIIVFQPLLTGIEEVIETVIRSRSKHRRVFIGDLGRLLGAEVDLRSMQQRLATTLQASLLVEPVHLWTLEQRNGERFLDHGGEQLALSPDSPADRLMRFFGSSPQQIHRRDLARVLRRLDVDEATELGDWLRHYQLLVPLVQQEEVRGVLALGPKLTGGRFHADDLAMVSLLAQQVTTSIENVRLVSENVQKRLLEEEVSVASEIQRELLPTVFPRCNGYESYAVTFASKLVGGDYFDLFTEAEHRVHLAIADVSGKGVPAALLMSSLHAALRSNVAHLTSPSQVLGRMNRLLYDITSPEKFATFFYAILDTEAHVLVYANAGHNYPLVVGADGGVRELREGGLLLGAFPHAQYEDGRLEVRPGDMLFLYTDGVTEARDGADEDFGTARLHDVVARASRQGPRAAVDSVLGAVRSFTSGAERDDDVTILAIQRPARETA